MQKSLSNSSQVSFSETKKSKRACGNTETSKNASEPAEIAASRLPIIFTKIKKTA